MLLVEACQIIVAHLVVVAIILLRVVLCGRVKQALYLFVYGRTSTLRFGGRDVALTLYVLAENL